MAHKIDQEGFRLEINASNIPRFLYDHEVIVQILINLIENSIKFGRKGAEHRISIDVDSKEKWVQISVSDTGPGIPKHALKKVFNDFYRVDNDLTRTTGGTGIGLALVNKFVLAMGGEVMAANNNDLGCTITIRLPRSIREE
jgi:signal transduction histidine kinase